MIFKSHSAVETEDLGAQLGACLRGGETIELISDLGGGKTTFVRGLVRGTGSPDHVASPTFILGRVYKTPKFDILHFDFYRLSDVGILEHELNDIKNDQTKVLVIEWAGVADYALPQNRVTVWLKSLGEYERTIEIQAPVSLKYLTDKL